MQLPHLFIASLLFRDLGKAVIGFGFLVGTLRTALVELSLAVLLTLLKLTKTLSFLLFLLLNAQSLPDLGLFSLLPLTLMRSNLVIKPFLSGASSILLPQGGIISESDLRLPDPDSLTFDNCFSFFLFLNF